MSKKPATKSLKLQEIERRHEVNKQLHYIASGLTKPFPDLKHIHDCVRHAARINMTPPDLSGTEMDMSPL